MILVTAAESLAIDKLSQFDHKPDYWMEIAGKQMAQKISKLVSSKKSLFILCGPGNNGGDGYVVARILSAKGYKKISVLGDESGSDLNKIKLDEVLRSKISVLPIGESHPDEILKLIQKSVVIDAVFGVGLSKEIQNPWREIFELVNKHAELVISLDIPSGLDATHGNVLGCGIKAQHTLSVLPLKSGLFLNAGPSNAGRIHKIEMNFPEQIIRKLAKSVRLIGRNACRQLLPRRKWSSHKAQFGNVLVIGGSSGFEGAALLVAEAALRSGAGYVSILSDSKDIFKRAKPDFMVHDFSKFENLLESKKITAIVFGPGLIFSEEAQGIFEKILKLEIPVVLDAGGFAFIKKIKLPNNWVLTPHAGELGKLLGEDSRSLEKSRLNSAAKAAKELGGVFLFKGFRTVIHSQGINYILSSGNPSLAKSGTGDVLAGIIGSLLAQGLSPEKAAAVGAWIHGDLADQRLRKGKSVGSLMASDLIEALQTASQ